MANIGEISVKIAADMTDFNNDMNRMGQTLSSVGDQVSQSTNQMSSSMQNMQNSISNATNQSGKNWDWLRDKMVASNQKMMTEATQSQKVIDNLSKLNIRGLDQQFLKIGSSLEKMARQGSITNVALKELGPSASFLDLKNQIKFINTGLARMQALQLGVGIAFLGMNVGLAKMSSIVDGRLGPAFDKFKATWLSALTPFVKAWTTGIVAIVNFGTAVGKAFDALGKFSPILSQIIFGFLFLTTALTLLLAPLAIGITAAGSFAVAFNLLWATISPFVTGLLTVIGTAMLWAAAIAIVVAAMYLLWTRSEAFRSVILSVWDAIKTGFQQVIAFIMPAVQAVTVFFIAQWNRVVQWWNGIWPTLAAAFQNIWTVISTILMVAMAVILGIIQAVWPIILVVIQTAWTIIQTIISTAITVIMNIINIFAALFTGNWSLLWTSVINIATALWNMLVTYLTALWNGIVQLATIIFTPILAFFSMIWTSVANFFVSVWTTVITTITTVWTSITTFLTTVWNGIKAFATAIWNGIKDFVVSAFMWMYNHNYYFKALVDAIVVAWNTAKAWTLNVWNAVKSFLSSVWNGIKSVATTVFNAIKSFITGVWNGIKSTASSVWNSIKSVITSAVNSVKSVITSAWNAIKSATSSAFNSVKSIASNIMSSIASALGGLASKAASWGSNLMNMFISGIKSKISSLTSMVSGVAKQVAGFLGFHSPTKWGPASDSDKWAPNLMNMFSSGIKAGIPDLRMSVTQAATVLSGMREANNPVSNSNSTQNITFNNYGSDQPSEKIFMDQMRRLMFLHGS